MKKYLQACELGGSIYGKKRNTVNKKVAGGNMSAREDPVVSYKKFFKTQMVKMDRVFRHDG